MDDLDLHLHSVASTNIPTESIMPTSVWVAVVHHTKAGDLKSVSKRNDFLWFKCRPEICVRTLKSYYFTRHFIEDVHFYHGQYEPDDLMQVKDLHKHSTISGNLFVLRAVNSDPCSENESKNERTAESDEATSDDEQEEEFQYDSSENSGRDKDHAIQLLDNESENEVNSDGFSVAILNGAFSGNGAGTQTTSAKQNVGAGRSDTLDTDMVDEEEEPTLNIRKRKFSSALDLSESPLTDTNGELILEPGYSKTGSINAFSGLQEPFLTSNSSSSVQYASEHAAPSMNLVETIGSAIQSVGLGKVPVLQPVNSVQKPIYVLEVPQTQKPTGKQFNPLQSNVCEPLFEEPTFLKPSPDLRPFTNSAALVNPINTLAAMNTITANDTEAGLTGETDNEQDEFATPPPFMAPAVIQSAADAQLKAEEAAWLARLEAHRAEETRQEAEEAEHLAEGELQTLFERDAQNAEADDADWGPGGGSEADDEMDSDG